MNKQILKIQKFLALPLLVTLLFFSRGAQKIHALVAVPTSTVFDVPNVAQSITQAITRQAADLVQEFSRITLDSAAYAVGQLILDRLTYNIITWVQGGFNGSPSFAVDSNKLFLDLADAVSGGMASQIRGIATCNFTPRFNNNLANMVAMEPRNRFAYRMRCPFNPFVINATDYYKDYDFKQGGWSGFEKALSDSGNPFGTIVLTSQELDRRQEDQRRAQEIKTNWSGGFIDLIDPNNCPSMPAEVTVAIANPDFPPEAKKAYQKAYCNVTTPGKIVGDRLGQAIGVDMNRVGFVDNINKIIGAVVKELTRQTLNGIFK